jgi:hypothetical protein
LLLTAQPEKLAVEIERIVNPPVGNVAVMRRKAKARACT